LKNRIILFIILLVVLPRILTGQEIGKEKNYLITGYIKDLRTIMFEKIDEEWIIDNMLHNRINFKWYMSDHFTSAIEMRSRFIYGEFVKIIPGYDELIDTDNGFIDLTTNLFSQSSFIFNTTIDRAWVEFFYGNFNIRAGRQRINWGQNFVWNPNDIFNSYSFFDFDYEERPGSDALRIQYYTGVSSLAEISVKADCNNDITAAWLFRFNKWKYDIQFIGGILNSEDLVIGTGWSGDIKGAGFRGEMSFFYPKKNFSDTSGIFIASVAGDYTFKNSLFLQFEMLYNGYAGKIKITSFDQYYYMPLSVKTLSFTEYSLFGQVSYPITPIFHGTLSGMFYPSIDGYFIGPSLELSIMENLDFSVHAQSFKGELIEDIKETLSFLFFRMRWSF